MSTSRISNYNQAREMKQKEEMRKLKEMSQLGCHSFMSRYSEKRSCSQEGAVAAPSNTNFKSRKSYCETPDAEPSANCYRESPKTCSPKWVCMGDISMNARFDDRNGCEKPSPDPCEAKPCEGETHEELEVSVCKRVVKPKEKCKKNLKVLGFVTPGTNDELWARCCNNLPEMETYPKMKFGSVPVCGDCHRAVVTLENENDRNPNVRISYSPVKYKKVDAPNDCIYCFLNRDPKTCKILGYYKETADGNSNCGSECVESSPSFQRLYPELNGNNTVKFAGKLGAAHELIPASSVTSELNDTFSAGKEVEASEKTRESENKPVGSRFCSEQDDVGCSSCGGKKSKTYFLDQHVPERKLSKWGYTKKDRLKSGDYGFDPSTVTMDQHWRKTDGFTKSKYRMGNHVFNFQNVLESREGDYDSDPASFSKGPIDYVDYSNDSRSYQFQKNPALQKFGNANFYAGGKAEYAWDDGDEESKEESDLIGFRNVGRRMGPRIFRPGRGYGHRGYGRHPNWGRGWGRNRGYGRPVGLGLGLGLGLGGLAATLGGALVPRRYDYDYDYYYRPAPRYYLGGKDSGAPGKNAQDCENCESWLAVPKLETETTIGCNMGSSGLWLQKKCAECFVKKPERMGSKKKCCLPPTMEPYVDPTKKACWKNSNLWWYTGHNVNAYKPICDINSLGTVPISMPCPPQESQICAPVCEPKKNRCMAIDVDTRIPCAFSTERPEKIKNSDPFDNQCPACGGRHYCCQAHANYVVKNILEMMDGNLPIPDCDVYVCPFKKTLWKKQ